VALCVVAFLLLTLTKHHPLFTEVLELHSPREISGDGSPAANRPYLPASALTDC